VNLIASFGPLGTPEMIIIAILVLVFFGAKKLPTFAKSLGRSMAEFRKAKEEFERELHRSADRRDDDDPYSLSDEDLENVERLLRPTFRQRHGLRGSNVLVLLMLVISAVFLVIGLSRYFGW
jgi:sec-independent protein translocase protein TatA